MCLNEMILFVMSQDMEEVSIEVNQMNFKPTYCQYFNI